MRRPAPETTAARWPLRPQPRPRCRETVDATSHVARSDRVPYRVGWLPPPTCCSPCPAPPKCPKLPSSRGREIPDAATIRRVLTVSILVVAIPVIGLHERAAKAAATTPLRLYGIPA